MKIFVVVVTFNGKQWYDRCFSSLLSSSIPVEVIVVDNASSDDTCEIIKTKYPHFTIIRSNSNLGFGKANNIGIRYAMEHNCDYVFLLNQDAWIEGETIKDMIDIHSRHPEYGILSPFHLTARKDHIEFGLIHYLDNLNITDRALFEDLYFERLSDVYTTKYVNAAAWLLPVNTINILGGFDPIFYHYGEDDNYLDRACYHNIKVGVCPRCVVVHDTERRLPSSMKKAKTSNANLLVEATDVNNEFPIFWTCLFHFRKAVRKLFLLNFDGFTLHRQHFLFLLKNCKAIRFSRQENINIGRTWL